MTLEQFTTRRKEELIAFFEARFGTHWRQIVAIQTKTHPRTFQRWKGRTAVSLYRQIQELEAWARSIGFQSAVDETVQAALKRYDEFAQRAAHEVERRTTVRHNDKVI